MRLPNQRMPLATSVECSEIDRTSQNRDGMDGLELMNRAGECAFDFLNKYLIPKMTGRSILILAGPGNNGGDAVVVARHLIEKGFTQVTLWTIGSDFTKSLESQLSAVPAFDVGLDEFRGTEDQRNILEAQSLIVDGIFGVGLSRPPDGLFEKAINWVNESALPVLSLDVPSGLDCNKGRALGVSVEAQWTVTFGVSKPGFYIWDGPRHVGEVFVCDIGFKDRTVLEIANSCALFDEVSAKYLMPKREDTVNKTGFGRVKVIAGSEGMWGAAILTGKGAFRAGAGYVELYSFDDPGKIVNETPDIMCRKIEDLEYVKDSVYVVGPGLGVGGDTISVIKTLMENGCEKVVLDADAISSLKDSNIKSLPPSWVMTPHSGELSRVIDEESAAIEMDRLGAAARAESRWGCTVLLKGFKTIIRSQSRAEIIDSGNSALATAGTGDVLAGIIGGLIGQGLKPADAAALGAFAHGRVADRWVREGNSRQSLMATDIIDRLPSVFHELEGKS